ncbi:D-serine ammonia-lyase [Priestia megaterium]|uniref:D-serine ammonia-lyase n=1 Tax=Priestia megaterium TaxID=1404 RepID=UPI00064CCA56|nr:D-serine ammonia-lyase [Priestia megaterium]KLV29537.1 serine ammonia-lyase [Priestia megaterium]MCE4090520.1 D-serine ammonia-lyase [Priestia megaterium]
MTTHLFHQKPLATWMREYPLLTPLINKQETLWINPYLKPAQEALSSLSLHTKDIKDAKERLSRFSSFLQIAFPELKASKGIIESPLQEITHMKDYLNQQMTNKLQGTLLMKCDHDLPISGSIKARGGIYEVLKFAESLAIKEGLLTEEDSYALLAEERCKKLFSSYSIAVGSTGNLGLSIGIISAALGFNVTVHMSADAKKWKKDLLRSKGVTVIEYQSDYGKAVEEGRKQAEADPACHFIDDEQSRDLFLGYSVAALRLKKQLAELQIQVDAEHPLFVYLPCGVGGGPGGITFGLKAIYGDHVHCFFAEPTHSPCMLLGLMTELHDGISVTDIGLDNVTAADGLAVGRPSSFVGETIKSLISGIYTVEDDQLFRFIYELANHENMYIEPSAAAGLQGPLHLMESGSSYIQAQALENDMSKATHLVWSTGGSMVPAEVMNSYYEQGKNLMNG